MTEEFDYAIAGAGLAGLSLAKSIIKSSSSARLTLIEPRTEYKRDHVWSFWNNAATFLSVPVKKQWQKWQVRYGGKTSLCSSTMYPYCTVFSEDYYDEALANLRDANGVTLHLGESLADIHYSQSNLILKTDRRSLSCRLLFDSRPPLSNAAEFKQDFFGIQVRTTKSAFDQDCLTLMDFREETVSKGFHFYYVLPFSTTEALVESVYIGLDNICHDEHRRLVLKYLKNEFGIEHFEEVNTERGCIPMHAMAMKQADPRHYSIGMRGGLLRSSTGYAFAAIHRFSDEMARSLRTSAVPQFPEPLSAKAKLLDMVLLTYLKQHPGDGPLLLSSLFERVAPDVVVRFLADSSSVVDDAAILAAMPRKFELGAVMAKSRL
jgi:lycopene beta-cyclase